MHRVKGMNGEILVNGKVRLPYSERWKRTSCYIQQDSILRTWITVGESMTLAAHLKLGCTISSAYKHTQVRGYNWPLTLMREIYRCWSIVDFFSSLYKKIKHEQFYTTCVSFERSLTSQEGVFSHVTFLFNTKLRIKHRFLSGESSALFFA